MGSRRNLELDACVQAIIDDEFAEFEQYLPNIQEVNVYRRKRKEYWDKVNGRLKEENAINGRTDDAVNG